MLQTQEPLQIGKKRYSAACFSDSEESDESFVCSEEEEFSFDG
jgi:hypothetical protein